MKGSNSLFLWDQIGEAIEEVRSNRSDLTELDLSNYNMGDEYGHRLGRALKQNQHLQVLRLRSNRLGLRSAQALVDAIRVHPSLVKLDVSHNWLRDDGCAILASTLVHSPPNHPSQCKLQVLQLNNNHITSVGATALATSLTNNNDNRLITLELEDNFCGPDGCRALAECLAHNCTLTTLALKGNYGGHVAARHFVRSLSQQNNTQIKHLTLDCSVQSQQQLDYFLYWNSFGRRALRSSTSLPTSSWPEILASCSTKPHLLFPMITELPGIFAVERREMNPGAVSCPAPASATLAV